MIDFTAGTLLWVHYFNMVNGSAQAFKKKNNKFAAQNSSKQQKNGCGQFAESSVKVIADHNGIILIG